MAGRLPDFIIIGAPKCGTTSLARWLGDHPRAHVPVAKEIHFFDRGWGRADLDWYRARLATSAGEAVVGEATPEYLAHPDVAARAASVLPDTRYIVIVRDPVERFWSHVWFAQRGRRDGRARDPATLIATEQAAGGPSTGMLTHGMYAQHLDRWAAAVGRQRLLPLTFDELSSDPVGTFTKVCDFVGLDPEPVPASVGDTYNAAHSLRSPRLRRWMLRHQVSTRAPRLGGRLDEWNQVSVEHPPIEPEIRRILSEWYADDTAELSKWIRVPETWSTVRRT